MDFWTSGKASACCVDLWVLEYDAEETGVKAFVTIKTRCIT